MKPYKRPMATQVLMLACIDACMHSAAVSARMCSIQVQVFVCSMVAGGAAAAWAGPTPWGGARNHRPVRGARLATTPGYTPWFAAPDAWGDSARRYAQVRVGCRRARVHMCVASHTSARQRHHDVRITMPTLRSLCP